MQIALITTFHIGISSQPQHVKSCHCWLPLLAYITHEIIYTTTKTRETREGFEVYNYKSYTHISMETCGALLYIYLPQIHPTQSVNLVTPLHRLTRYLRLVLPLLYQGQSLHSSSFRLTYPLSITRLSLRHVSGGPFYCL